MPQNLAMVPFVSNWILIYQNWSIAGLSINWHSINNLVFRSAVSIFTLMNHGSVRGKGEEKKLRVINPPPPPLHTTPPSPRPLTFSFLFFHLIPLTPAVRTSMENEHRSHMKKGGWLILYFPYWYSNRHENLEFVKGDACDLESFAPALEGKDAVLSSLGSFGSIFNPTTFYSESVHVIMEGMKRYFQYLLNRFPH